VQKFHEGRRALSELFDRSLEKALFWSVPMCVGGTLLADRIILFVFGGDYSASIRPFQILIWNCIVLFLSSAMVGLVYAAKRQKETVWIFFVGAVVNTGLNIFVIPKYGIAGAALTTLATECVVLMGIIGKAKKVADFHIVRNLVKPLLASLAMLGFLMLFYNDSLILTISLGTLIYFGTYYLITPAFRKWTPSAENRVPASWLSPDDSYRSFPE
jgi:O-antigen/teichoic acid export membrane protein